MKTSLQIRSFESLRDAHPLVDMEGVQPHSTVRCHEWRVLDRKVKMEDLRGSVWSITKSTFERGLVVAGARWESLMVRECAAESVILEDCVIDELDVRELMGRLVLTRCRVLRLRVHDTRRVAATDFDFGTAQISGIERSLRLTHVAGKRMRLEECRGSDELELRIRDAQLREDLLVEDCESISIFLKTSVIRRLSVNRCLLSQFDAAEVEVRGRTSLSDLKGDGEASPAVSLGGHFRGSVELSVSKGPITLACTNSGPKRVEGTSIEGDLTVSGDIRVELLQGRISGTLRAISGEVQPRVTLRPQFALERVAVQEDTTIRGVRDARAAGLAILGAADVNALATLRRSLEARPRLQDQVYFAERCLIGSGWLDWVKRWVFGYGVRFLEPLGALVLGILVTALVIWALGLRTARYASRGEMPFDGLLSSFVEAAQLWFNVGVGLPAYLSGPGWAAAAVVCTIIGLVLVTTLIGIGIRRLVR